MREKREGFLAIKVYVDQKVPKDQLDHPAPSRVAMSPILTTEVPIDVEAIGRIRLEWDPIRHYTRPVIIGSSEAHQGVLAGTIGLLVRKLDDAHPFLLAQRLSYVCPVGHGDRWGSDFTAEHRRWRESIGGSGRGIDLLPGPFRSSRPTGFQIGQMRRLPE